MCFNLVHTSIKYSSLLKLSSVTPGGHHLFSVGTLTVTLSLPYVHEVDSNVLNFSLILPMINGAFWLIKAPFGFDLAYGLEFQGLFQDLQVHFISHEILSEPLLNHNIHRQLPRLNIKLHLTFGDSITVPVRHLQIKDYVDDKPVCLLTGSLGTVKRIIVEGEMC